MTSKIELHADLSGGRVYSDDLSDGDTLTIFGVRYEIGMDYGDGQGASLKPISFDAYPSHDTIEDHDWDAIDVPESLQMTVAEYRRICPDCTGEFFDANDESLTEDDLITIMRDNTWCVGKYDGNQYCESLI